MRLPSVRKLKFYTPLRFGILQPCLIFEEFSLYAVITLNVTSFHNFQMLSTLVRIFVCTGF